MKRVMKAVLLGGVGVFLFAGLPLIGWGVTDVRGFAGNGARLVYLVMTVLLQLVIALFFPEVGQGSGEGRDTVRRQKIAIVLLQIFSLALVVVGPYCDRRALLVINRADVLRFLGLFLFLAGFVIMNGAQVSLGKQFSVQVTIQDGHRLKTDGLFRHIRHPRYLGIILFNFGFSLVFRSYLALLLSTTLMAVLVWRIHDEEALLRHEFGGEWDAFVKRSWRLLPFVW